MREFLYEDRVALALQGPIDYVAREYPHAAELMRYALNGWKEAEDRVWNIERFLFERGLMYDWACWKHGAPNDRDRGPQNPNAEQSTGRGT